MFHQLEQVDGVRKVHNLRVWALTLDKVILISLSLYNLSDTTHRIVVICIYFIILLVFFALQVAISAHLAINPSTNAQQVLRDASVMLEHNFGVYESTIQAKFV